MKRMIMSMLVGLALLAPSKVFAQQWGDALIASQAVTGGGYITEIIATSVSPDPNPTQAKMDFGSQFGQAMYVEVTDLVTGNNRNLVQGYNTGDIPAGGMRKILLTSSSTVPVSGYLILKSLKTALGGDSVQFSVKYLSPDGGRASVVPVHPAMTLAFPSVKSGGDQTGIAIANWNAVPAVLSCKVRNYEGVEVASAPVAIPAWGQIAKFVGELFTLPTTWTGGRVNCTSNTSLAATTLETNVDEKGKFTFSTGTTFPLPQ